MAAITEGVGEAHPVLLALLRRREAHPVLLTLLGCGKAHPVLLPLRMCMGRPTQSHQLTEGVGAALSSPSVLG